MTEDPWKVLSLDRTTASEREVRAAYARLIKEHKPDRDPEGFQRVRAAYEAALAFLRHKEGTGLESDAEPAPRAPVRPDRQPPDHDAPAIIASAPAATKGAMENLKQAVAGRARQKIRDAWAAYDAEADTAGLTLGQRFSDIQSAFLQNLSLLAELVTDARLLKHVAAGENRLPDAVLAHWALTADVKRLTEFSSSLAKSGQIAESDLGAALMLRTAIGLAAWQPALAETLAHKAFPHVSASLRPDLTAHLDQELFLGRVLAPFSPGDKTFWLAQVRGTAPRCNWRDNVSRQVLVTALKLCGPRWPGFEILHRTMPPEAWADMARALQSLVR